MFNVTEYVNVTSQKTRLLVLDVLRGIAILGILVPNIVSFAGPDTFLELPGTLTQGLDAWVEVFKSVFFAGKMRGMLSILFGVGLAMQFEKLSAKEGKWPSLYLRRTVLLMAIGLVHLLIIWSGDILFIYAITALFAVAFVRVSDRFVLMFAVIMLWLSIFVGTMFGALSLFDNGADQSAEGFFANISTEAQIAAFQHGSFLDQLKIRSYTVFFQVSTMQLIVPHILSGFLVGLLLGRSNVLSKPSENKRVRNICLFVGFGVGLPLSLLPLIGYMAGSRFNFNMPIELGGGLVLGLGYIMLGAVILENSKGGFFATVLANVGRFALSCYLLQTLVLTCVFYSWGGGLYNQISPSQQLLFVLGTWILVIVFATFWSKKFMYGPVEWLWRSLTYKEKLPIRKAD